MLPLCSRYSVQFQKDLCLASWNRAALEGKHELLLRDRGWWAQVAAEKAAKEAAARKAAREAQERQRLEAERARQQVLSPYGAACNFFIGKLSLKC